MKTVEEKISLKTLIDTINQPCIIKPFEINGHIIAIFITKKGVEYQCRYYLNGEQKSEYFFNWEIEIL